MATFAQYEELVKQGKIDPNTPLQKSSTIDAFIDQIDGGYYTLGFCLLIILVAIYMFKRYKMIDKIKSIENKTITKIVIILTIFWVANSFIHNYHDYGYGSDKHYELNLKRFLGDQIIPLLVYGFLWVTNKLTLK